MLVVLLSFEVLSEVLFIDVICQVKPSLCTEGSEAIVTAATQTTSTHAGLKMKSLIFILLFIFVISTVSLYLNLD